MKNITKKIAFLGVLSALYIVLSLSLKIPTGVGNISFDFGYIVLTVASVFFGPLAAIVGGIGAALSSILTSAYGFSISWTVMNIVIGLLFGFLCTKINKVVNLIPLIILSVALGVAFKTGIECVLYSIPLAVKIPKALVAFALDSTVMIVGLPIAKTLQKRIKMSEW